MKRPCSGFTLVELLVVASIMALLFAFSTASYNQFNRSQILNQAVLELKNNFRLAQNMALTGEKPLPSILCDSLEGYRVTFTSSAEDFYQIQAQCSNGLVGTTKTFYFPTVVRLGTSPPPPFFVVFKVLGRGVEGAGTITLSAFGINKTVTVTSTGEIR